MTALELSCYHRKTVTKLGNMFKISIDKSLSMFCVQNSMSVAVVATHAVFEFNQNRGRFLGEHEWEPINQDGIIDRVLANPVTKCMSVPHNFELRLNEIRGTCEAGIFLNYLIRAYLQSNGHLPAGWVLETAPAPEKKVKKEKVERPPRQPLKGGLEQRIIDQINRCGATPPATIDRPRSGSWFFKVPVTCSCGSPTTVSTRKLFRAEKEEKPLPIKCAQCRVAPRVKKASEISSQKASHREDLIKQITERINKLGGILPEEFPEKIGRTHSLPLPCACGGTAKKALRYLFDDNLTGIRCYACGIKYRTENQRRLAQKRST